MGAAASAAGDNAMIAPHADDGAQLQQRHGRRGLREIDGAVLHAIDHRRG
jgi:hypothetical protein